MSFTIWLTGRPRAGKTTLGRMLAAELGGRLAQVRHLDGDDLRRSLCADLGFSPEERRRANLRTAFVAGLLNEHGVACVVGQIAPYQSIRDELRAVLPGYVEVYLDCPLEQAINRDQEGLYARALAMSLPGFTGLNDPYEPPLAPQVHCLTHRQTPAESLADILAHLETTGLIPPGPGGIGPEPYTPEERELIEQRLKDLGYL